MNIHVKSQTELSGYYIIFNGSAAIERKGERGSSHLMEHILCDSRKHLDEDMKRDGVGSNASTYQNFVAFYITGLDEYVNKYAFQLLDLIQNYEITNKILEKERKIVLEEYKDYFNQQSSAHSSNLNRKLYDYYSAIGEKTDIENITLEQCKNLQKERFSKPYQVIHVTHNKPIENPINFTEDNHQVRFPRIENNSYIHQDSNYFKNKTSIQIHSPVISRDLAIMDFISGMLGSGLVSPLYKVIREKYNLVYFLDSYISLTSLQNNVYIFSTQTSNENTQEVIKLFKEVINNPKKYMTKTRFDIYKSSQIISYKKSKINAYSTSLSLMYPKNLRLELIINDLKYDQVMEVYNKYFNIKDFYISDDKTEFTS